MRAEQNWFQIFLTVLVATPVSCAIVLNATGKKQFAGSPPFALVTRRPYCPGRPKELCLTTPSLAVETMVVRLGVVKQSFFGLPGQYGRRVTRANAPSTLIL